MSRRYSNLKETAATIASEIVLEGKSSGWAGSLEELASLESLLKNYNIFYVDDFGGVWKQVMPRGYYSGVVGAIVD